jgi:hypothetical protein
MPSASDEGHPEPEDKEWTGVPGFKALTGFPEVENVT